MPGVLIVEAMAQAGGILLYHSIHRSPEKAGRPVQQDPEHEVPPAGRPGRPAAARSRDHQAPDRSSPRSGAGPWSTGRSWPRGRLSAAVVDLAETNEPALTSSSIPRPASIPEPSSGPACHVGPGCVIGEQVVDRPRTRGSRPMSQIAGRTEIGEDCRVLALSAIGGEPQDIGYKGETTGVVIGDRNVFREFVTVHRGTTKGRRDDDDRLATTISWPTPTSPTIAASASETDLHQRRDSRRPRRRRGFRLDRRLQRRPSVLPDRAIRLHRRVHGHHPGRLPFCRVAGQRPVRVSRAQRRRPPAAADSPGSGSRALKEMFKILFYSDLNTTQAVERIKAHYPAQRGPRGDPPVHRVVQPRHHQEDGGRHGTANRDHRRGRAVRPRRHPRCPETRDDLCRRRGRAAKPPAGLARIASDVPVGRARRADQGGLASSRRTGPTASSARARSASAVFRAESLRPRFRPRSSTGLQDQSATGHSPGRWSASWNPRGSRCSTRGPSGAVPLRARTADAHPAPGGG